VPLVNAFFRLSIDAIVDWHVNWPTDSMELYVSDVSGKLVVSTITGDVAYPVDGTLSATVFIVQSLEDSTLWKLYATELEALKFLKRMEPFGIYGRVSEHPIVPFARI